MIGGPPVTFAPDAYSGGIPPGYGAPPYGAVPYPPPGYVVQPPAAPRPSPPPVRAAQAPAPRPAAIRAQAPDDIPPQVRTAQVAMPSPAQLSVTARPAEGVCDWTAIHRRLQNLGVISFQVDRLNEGLYQFTCLMPTTEAGRTHRIEANGTTEAEAARLALDEAQRWASRR